MGTLPTRQYTPVPTGLHASRVAFCRFLGEDRSCDPPCRRRPIPIANEVSGPGRARTFELVADRATKAVFPPGDRTGYYICLSLRDRGIFLRPLGDVIPLMPPLSSTDAELKNLAEALRAAIVERLGA